MEAPDSVIYPTYLVTLFFCDEIHLVDETEYESVRGMLFQRLYALLVPLHIALRNHR